jgi:hypothetical protein
LNSTFDKRVIFKTISGHTHVIPTNKDFSGISDGSADMGMVGTPILQAGLLERAQQFKTMRDERKNRMHRNKQVIRVQNIDIKHNLAGVEAANKKLIELNQDAT